MDKPTWERGDTLKSIHAVALLARNTLARLIGNAAEYIDTREAGRINRPEDE